MHAALKEQIAGLERRLWLEGSEAFDKIMAPECFMVFPKPIGILTRQEILASLGNFARWDEVTIEGALATADRKCRRFQLRGAGEAG